jgi:hypothetical protein
MSFVADLRLRFGAVRLPVRVHLPWAWGMEADRRTLVIWIGARNLGDPVCRELSDVAASVVLELSGRDVSGGSGHEEAVLGWAAEHAREFGAPDRSLVVAGRDAGAARAAWLAIAARDSGWPVLRRQLLVRPAFPPHARVPYPVAGTAPATIVTAGRRRDDGRRYAAALREAGVEVQELTDEAGRTLRIQALAGALR